MRNFILILWKVFTSRAIHIALIALVFELNGSLLNGQSIDKPGKLWQNNNLKYLIGNQKDKLFSSVDFYNYSRIRDEEFADYLKISWSDFSIFAGISEEYSNRPLAQPAFNDSDVDRNMNPPVSLPFSMVTGDKNRLAQTKRIPRIRKPASDDFSSLQLTFVFYGQKISLDYDELLKLTKITTVSVDSLSVFWKSFSLSNSNHLVDQLMDYRDLLGLGDWGYFQLVKATSNQLFKDNFLNSDLLTWALMVRSGFDVRLAFNQNRTTVLFSSENTIYSRQFVLIGQKRFYLDRAMNSQLLVTSQKPYPDSEELIDLGVYKTLNFKNKTFLTKMPYHWNFKNFNFTFHNNPDIVQFYKDYPRTDPLVYFEAPVSSGLKEDLLEQFYPLLSKMNRPEAVSFLLHFVQKEFTYSSEYQDNKEFPGCFAEEIIASKSGDDRARSVLFLWLVRTILRSPAFGVQFPGHLAAAVSIEEPLDGDYYSLNGLKYYISDPTFLNAPIGMVMPEFLGLTPKLIELSYSFSTPFKKQQVWNLASGMGAKRGGPNQDITFDQQGRALITGYFSDRSSKKPFVACFSKENSLQWIRKFEGDGNAVAFSVTKNKNDEIYIAGSFSGKLYMDGKTLESGMNNADLFIAQFNHQGQLMWMNKAGIDTIAQNESMSYMYKFDRSGENNSMERSNEDLRNINSGFVNIGDNMLCFKGAGNTTPGMNPFLWPIIKPDISVEIAKEYKTQLSGKYLPRVAGIVAVMKQLQKYDSEVTGIQLQKVITRISPSFQSSNSLLFKMIGQILRLRNDNGIVTIHTIGKKSIFYNNLRLDDGATFNLSFFGNGDVSIGTISGFHFIVKQVPLTLNNLLIDISTGNIIYDYDQDHTLKTGLL